MKKLNYSNITATIRRIHQATLRSKKTGIPIAELLDQDKELRLKLQAQRLEDKQRRDFMKTVAGIGLGAGLLPIGNLAFAAQGGVNGQGDTRVAIIGAGAGGLRTAHRLMQYGWTSTVYEANTRIGGRMYSNSDYFSDDRVVEWGGEFISTEHTAIRNLAHQLHLKLEDANKLSVGNEETYLIDGQLYSESNLMDEWVGGLYETFKRAQMDAPWQPLYNSFNDEHMRLDQMTAIDWLTEIGYDSAHWVHKLLMTDLVAEYGLLEENSALNLIYLLAWNTHNSGGLPLAGTDERLHVVGGNDLIPQRMAAELHDGTIQIEHKLTEIHGDHSGPYSLKFANIPGYVEYDKLVLAMPYGLIRELEYFDPNITAQFSDEKNLSIAEMLQADNGKVQMEFSDRHWDRVHTIDGEEINQAARAYSNPDGFISTWEGEPGNTSPLGLLVDYNGGVEGKTLRKASGANDSNDFNNFFGIANQRDVNRVMPQIEQIWPGISAKYTGKALVSNWWDNPYSKGAFVSPAVNTMTVWWGAQWETEGNIYFAGEACDEEVWSYMDGAIRSGERVAQEIAQS